MKIIFTAMLLTGCLVLSTARAEMLYQFKFDGADDAARLKSSGTQKVTAELKKIDGQTVKFIPDTPAGSGNAAEFTFQPKGNRAAMLLVPGSRDKISFSKPGEKLSISLWIKRANDKEGGILGNFSGDGKAGWLLSVLPDGAIRFRSTAYGHRNSVETTPKNQWTHVAVVYEPGNQEGLKIYINGKSCKLLSTSYIGKNSPVAGVDDLRIGAGAPGQYQPVCSALWDVRLYNEALTPEAVAKLSSEGKAKGK